VNGCALAIFVGTPASSFRPSYPVLERVQQQKSEEPHEDEDDDDGDEEEQPANPTATTATKPVRIYITVFNQFMYNNIFFNLQYSFNKAGSQTFSVRGPLKIIWWSTKHKILVCIGIRGPLQLISRTTSGPWSRLWESLY